MGRRELGALRRRFSQCFGHRGGRSDNLANDKVPQNNFPPFAAMFPHEEHDNRLNERRYGILERVFFEGHADGRADRGKDAQDNKE